MLKCSSITLLFGHKHFYDSAFYSLVVHLVKNPLAMSETWVRSLGWEDPLEKGKATHSSILAWRIPWTKSMGLQRVGHNGVTFIFNQCNILCYLQKSITYIDYKR